ncbi:MAG: 16S rRNA (cytosine(967)-C(5))-methyltransferase RsmB [Cyanobacteriota bacterium]|nr:16S rRNA (cytosine(967)-C(5))-methyltransferase RsmB [Cyanobacteriota bacterium]
MTNDKGQTNDEGQTTARQLAFQVLREIGGRGAYTDIALDRVLGQEEGREAKARDRALATELVYGCVRRQRTLHAIIDQMGKKTARQQPPDLRIILEIGLYQLRYLDRLPPAAVVHTSVELAKANGLKKLSGVVNGMLRQYLRATGSGSDLLQYPADPVQRIAIAHSYPDWIIQLWLDYFGKEETEQLCQWFNRPPTLDLRVNSLHSSLEGVEATLTFAISPDTSSEATGDLTMDLAEELDKEIKTSISHVPPLPHALRLRGKTGSIQELPGFKEGQWTVQDASAQLVVYLLNPQPGETVVDACAAPGGKTTHIAELMEDKGTIWACDAIASRLRKVTQNASRLRLQSIQTLAGDSRNFPQFVGDCDRVLVDAPCSGLGTLHRHPDIRWRQTPKKVQELTVLQQELLISAATWVKPGGILVYATCTLNPTENQEIVKTFLETHHNWQIDTPSSDSPAATFVQSSGWIQILPTQHQMDGFFMVRLKKGQGLKMEE